MGSPFHLSGRRVGTVTPPFPCLVCGGREAKAVFREFDVDILRCRSCGHIFSSWNAPPDYDGYFGYQPIEGGDHFWWDEAHRAPYERFGRMFLEGRGGNLLDVGCGLGYFLRSAASRPGWTVYGCEISRAAAGFAAGRLGLERVFQGRMEDAGYPDGLFDLVTLWDVLEHIRDPRTMLAEIRRILKPGGRLFIQTPEAGAQLLKARLKRLRYGLRAGIHYLEARDHLNLYAPRVLRRVLASAGFTDVRFHQLPPIQSVAGSRNRVLVLVKNAWYQLSRGASTATFGRVQLAGLFVTAARGRP